MTVKNYCKYFLLVMKTYGSLAVPAFIGTVESRTFCLRANIPLSGDWPVRFGVFRHHREWHHLA